MRIYKRCVQLRMIRYLFLILINFTFTLDSYGCLCISPTIKQSLDDPHVIILKGKVVYVGLDSTNKDRRGYYPTVQKIKIIESWKGLDSSVKYIAIYPNRSSCDFTFIKDSTYLIYTYPIGEYRDAYPFYTTNVCTRTSLISKAKLDLDSLGNGRIHHHYNENINGNLKETSNREKWKGYVLVISVLLNLILIGYIIKIKK